MTNHNNLRDVAVYQQLKQIDRALMKIIRSKGVPTNQLKDRLYVSRRNSETLFYLDGNLILGATMIFSSNRIGLNLTAF